MLDLGRQAAMHPLTFSAPLAQTFPRIRSLTLDIATLKDRHPEHWRMAAAIRTLTLDAVAAANSGHSGMPMGMADVATVLFTKHLSFDATAPNWPDRDRFILSAGHGSMLLYSLLHLTGYADMTLDQIRAFRQWGSITAGHPEYGHADGIETTTGPLGQGIANSVGFAIAEESLRARLGAKLVNHRTWVIAGDGCLMEGVSQEAIALAGKLELSRLCVLWDNNGITIDGKVSLADVTDQKARFAASGWNVMDCDGHDPEAIDAAMTKAKKSKKPVLIACHTHIALGSAAQDTAKGHGALTDAKIVADTKAVYGWDYPAFHIPADIMGAWADVGARGRAAREAWEARLAALTPARQAALTRQFANEPHKRLAALVRAVKAKAVEDKPKMASRSASELVLKALNPVLTENVGGSADLTGSNNTRTPDLGVFGPEDRKGRYIHFGIREHGMAAAMNGMALHGGVRPYGGTFMCFTDYARPAMRLSALMGVPVVYVMTHDSIGLGEDGPTHQPVEHLAISRATPNTLVIRPADLVETAEAWEVAFGQTKRPTVLALSRQNLPAVRLTASITNLVAKGGYVLSEAEGTRRAILMATGSEVEIALKAQALLQAEGIGTRVVSMPCMELFAAQDEAWRKRVLPAGPVRVAVEAGVRQGWDRWLMGERGRAEKSAFVGMTGFGASAPYDRLYKEFGITAEAVADKVRALLSGAKPAASGPALEPAPGPGETAKS
jgi:transketolase